MEMAAHFAMSFFLCLRQPQMQTQTQKHMHVRLTEKISVHFFARPDKGKAGKLEAMNSASSRRSLMARIDPVAGKQSNTKERGFWTRMRMHNKGVITVSEIVPTVRLHSGTHTRLV